MTFQKYLRQLGRNIREARKRSGMKQIEVHASSGVTYRHYQDIEAGRVNVTIETLYRLAQVYKIEIAQLVKRDG